MRKYERVTFTDGDKRRTVILEVTSESDLFVFGIEVDLFGDEVRHGKVDLTRRFIDKTLITRRVPMTMSLKYAQLFRTAR